MNVTDEKKEVDVQREIVKRLLTELQAIKEGRRVEGLLDEDERSTSSVAVLLTRLQLKEAECERMTYEAKEKDRLAAEQSSQLTMRSTAIADLQAEVARLMASSSGQLPKKSSATGSSLLSRTAPLSSSNGGKATSSASPSKKTPAKISTSSTTGSKTGSVKKGSSSSNKGSRVSTSSSKTSTTSPRLTKSPKTETKSKSGSTTRSSHSDEDEDELLDSNSLRDGIPLHHIPIMLT
jgi:uncharacterized small protein (DUF1192 family)